METKRSANFSKRPSGIELSYYEKGGMLATKTDEPPPESLGLGLLGNEDWIISLGSANAHTDNLIQIHGNIPKETRLRNRLTASSNPKPWKALPTKYMDILSQAVERFEDSLQYDNPKNNEAQQSVLMKLTTMLRKLDSNQSETNEITYDVLSTFLVAIYPLLTAFDAHCESTTGVAAAESPKRDRVQVEMLITYTAYRRVIASHRKETRDMQSNLRFDALSLPEQQPSAVAGDSTSIVIGSGGASGGSTSPRAVKTPSSPLGGAAAAAVIGGVPYQRVKGGRLRRCCRRLCWFAEYLPCCRCIRPLLRKKRHRGDDIDYLDPELSLSDVMAHMRRDHRKELKRKRFSSMGVAVKNRNDDDDDDDVDDNDGILSYTKGHLFGRCTACVRNTMSSGLLSILYLLPVISLGINLLLSIGLDSETFFSYVPSEREESIKLMTIVAATCDLLTAMALPTYLHFASKHHQLLELIPGDRMVRLRPIAVMIMLLFCGATEIRFVITARQQEGEGVSSALINQLAPFAAASVIAHVVVVLFVFSMLYSFVKKVDSKVGKRTYCNVVCLCSWKKMYNTGSPLKAAYRADVAGKGLEQLIQDKAANERQLAEIMSFPDWNKTVKTRRKVRYIRQEAKLYRKAVKSMKVEIAVKMMTIMYGSKDAAQRRGLPSEICVAAVFFASHHNVKEYINRNFLLRRQLDKVLAMDAVWSALVARYQYAKNGGNESMLQSSVRQLNIFLQRDVNLRNINIAQYHTKKRLKMAGNFAMGIGKNVGNLITKNGSKRGQDGEDGTTLRDKKHGSPAKPMSKYVFDGVVGRDELYEELIGMHSGQIMLNSRISVESLDKLEWKHVDWSAAAAAANQMHVLHKGWTTRVVRKTKKSKSELMYFNRKLNARLRQRLAYGVTKKQLPEFLKQNGNKIPHGNMWTARSMFENFRELVRVNSPRYRNEISERSESRLRLKYVEDIAMLEHQWSIMERDLNDKLTNYITTGNPNMKKSFRLVKEQLKETAVESNTIGAMDYFDPLNVFGQHGDSSSSSSESDDEE